MVRWFNVYGVTTMFIGQSTDFRAPNFRWSGWRARRLGLEFGSCGSASHRSVLPFIWVREAMPDIIRIIFSILGMLAVYGMGLLFWPTYWLTNRERGGRSRALFWLFIAQSVLYCSCGFWMLVVGLRGGAWIEGLALVWPLNLLFVLLNFAVLPSRGRAHSAEVKHVS